MNNAIGCVVYQKYASTQHKISNLSFIKKMCIDALFTYEGYLKAVQKKLGKVYKIPVYFDDENMFFPIKRTRDYENIWINYATVQEIRVLTEQIEIIFESQQKLQVNISLNSLKRQIKYLEEIRNVKVKPFHS
ncbi:MAG: competence protein ComK [Bacillota bacterium]